MLPWISRTGFPIRAPRTPAPRRRQQSAAMAVQPRHPAHPGLSNRRQDKGGIEDRGKRHEADAIGESIGNLVGYSHHEPGLAHPTGPNQSDEWRIGTPEQRVEGVDLTLPPNRGVRNRGRGAHESRSGAAWTIRIGKPWRRSAGLHEAWVPPAAAAEVRWPLWWAPGCRPSSPFSTLTGVGLDGLLAIAIG